MKKLILLSLIPLFSLAQTQIGGNINGEEAGDLSGSILAISSDGNIVAISSQRNDGVNGEDSGHVRVYENLGGVWTQIGEDIDGEAEGDLSGSSIGLSSDGSIVAIGAFSADTSAVINGGHVRVFENVGGVWTQVGDDIDATSEFAGASNLAISSNGNIVAVGATISDTVNGAISGMVRVFENVGGVWTQIGGDILGEAGGDLAGEFLSLSNDGSIVAIGSRFNSGNGGPESGHVRVFENVGGVWTQIGDDIDGQEAFDRCGKNSLSGDGRIIALGSRLNDANGAESGSVSVFENVGGVWTQIGDSILGEAAGDFSGDDLSLSNDGSILAIGSPGNNDNGVDSGLVRIFRNTGGVWTQVGDNIYGDAGDSLGSVALSSDGAVVAIGAPFSNGNGVDSGQVRVYDLSAILSTEDIANDSGLIIYPNPATTNVQIQLSKDTQLQKVVVYNSLGQEVYVSEAANSLDISSLSSGLHVVVLTTNKGTVSRKLMIR